jgi:hypothetical protein
LGDLAEAVRHEPGVAEGREPGSIRTASIAPVSMVSTPRSLQMKFKLGEIVGSVSPQVRAEEPEGLVLDRRDQLLPVAS